MALKSVCLWCHSREKNCRWLDRLQEMLPGWRDWQMAALPLGSLKVRQACPEREVGSCRWSHSAQACRHPLGRSDLSRTQMALSESPLAKEQSAPTSRVTAFSMDPFWKALPGKRQRYSGLRKIVVRPGQLRPAELEEVQAGQVLLEVASPPDLLRKTLLAVSILVSVKPMLRKVSYSEKHSILKIARGLCCRCSWFDSAHREQLAQRQADRLRPSLC